MHLSVLSLKHSLLPNSNTSCCSLLEGSKCSAEYFNTTLNSPVRAAIVSWWCHKLLPTFSSPVVMIYHCTGIRCHWLLGYNLLSTSAAGWWLQLRNVDVSPKKKTFLFKMEIQKINHTFHNISISLSEFNAEYFLTYILFSISFVKDYRCKGHEANPKINHPKKLLSIMIVLWYVHKCLHLSH